MKRRTVDRVPILDITIGSAIVQPSIGSSSGKETTSHTASPVSASEEGDGQELPTNEVQEEEGSFPKRSTFGQKWKAAIETLTLPVKYALLFLSHYAARYPYLCVLSTIAVSIALAVTGWQTNFVIESRENELWKPIGGMAEKDGAWIDNGGFSGNQWSFNYPPDDDDDSRRLASIIEQGSIDHLHQNHHHNRQLQGGYGVIYITTILHKSGENVVTKEGGDRLFEHHDLVVNTPGYEDFCSTYGIAQKCPWGLDLFCSIYDIPTGDDERSTTTCETIGPTSFFLNDSNSYKARAKTDRDVQEAMSFSSYPGKNDEFNIKHIIGYPIFGDDGILESATSFTTVFSIAENGEGAALTDKIVDRILDLRDEWGVDRDHPYSIEVFTTKSFQSEFQRGLIGDLPFVFVAFVIMSVFTMFCFSKWKGRSLDWVNSRGTLGLGAVCTVLLSIMTGYGLLFCFGVPFTAITQLLPYVMFGIGLDDAFILMTAYGRTDHQKDPVDRVHDTMEEVGLSIFMTTATSVFAFGLGCTSTTPAVRWLCLYAFPTITIDFVYQITFFVALIVIDEKRLQARRRDCLCCCVVPGTAHKEEDEGTEQQAAIQEKHFSERFMIAYAEILLKRPVKILVLVVFSALLGVCAYSASKMRVAFDFTAVLPRDSFLIDFNDAFDAYAQRPSISADVYFRFVDQSDPEIQKQMQKYIDDIVEKVDGVSDQPLFFWLSDYRKFVEENSDEFFWLSFNETLHEFLATEKYSRYRSSFVMDQQGSIVVSKTKIDLDNISLSDVNDYLGAFRALRKVGSEHPLNQNGDWAFFNFEAIYYLWEFLDNTTGELYKSIVYAVSAVTAIALLVMPHWSAVLFLTPMVIVLFIDFVGFLQFFGVTINGISYIALVMSVGLVSQTVARSVAAIMCLYVSFLIFALFP